jgi:hypothetical protein
VLIFLATRLVAWTGAYLGAGVRFCIHYQWEPNIAKRADVFVREHPDFAATPEYRTVVELLANLAPLSGFDAHHYQSIIENGYQYQPPPREGVPHQYNIAFFPLYPLICSPFARIMTIEAAQVLISHLCALAAAVLLYLWIRRRIDEGTALFAVAAVFCLPAACYYSFGYAESSTLLGMVAALWLIDRRAFLGAAVAAGLTTATRPTALAIVPVFALAYWLNAPAARSRRFVRLGPLTLLAAAGILAYAAYLTCRFGSPLVYFTNFKAWVSDHARADWIEYATLVPVWSRLKDLLLAIVTIPPGLIQLANPLVWNMPFNLFVLFLSLAGLGRVPRSFRPLLLLGPFIFIHSYLASGGGGFGIDPIARYMAVSVPALVVLAAWCVREWKPAARHVLLTFMLLLQAAWAFRFGLGEWSG